AVPGKCTESCRYSRPARSSWHERLPVAGRAYMTLPHRARVRLLPARREQQCCSNECEPPNLPDRDGRSRHAPSRCRPSSSQESNPESAREPANARWTHCRPETGRYTPLLYPLRPPQTPAHTADENTPAVVIPCFVARERGDRVNPHCKEIIRVALKELQRIRMDFTDPRQEVGIADLVQLRALLFRREIGQV